MISQYLLLHLGPVLLLILVVLNQIQELRILVIQCLIECLVVNLLKDRLQGIQRLLEYLMPVCVSNLGDDWHQEWECECLVTLQDCEEVVILKETHGSISHLQVGSCNALDESLEQFGDQWFQLGDFTHFQHFQ